MGRDNRFSLPPLPLGQNGPGQREGRPLQYKDHTSWPPLPANFQLVGLHVSQTNPSEQKYLVYYLELCPTKHVTIYTK